MQETKQQVIEKNDDLLEQDTNAETKVEENQLVDTNNPSDTQNSDLDPSINDIQESLGEPDDSKSDSKIFEIKTADEYHLSSDSLDELLDSPTDSPVYPIDQPERHRSFTDAFLAVATVRQHPGRLVLALAATLIVIVLLILLVSYRHQILELGYDISHVTAERESLLEEQRKLRIELRILSRRDRLEPIAKRNLGMQPVRPDQVYLAPKDQKVPQKTPKTDNKRRADGLDNIQKIME